VSLEIRSELSTSQIADKSKTGVVEFRRALMEAIALRTGPKRIDGLHAGGAERWIAAGDQTHKSAQ